MLVLVAGFKRKRPVTVGDAWVGSGAPATTAQRRIRGLELAGILVRGPDAADARRSLLHLTPDAEERLVHYLA